MKIAVTGATGNVGTAVLRALHATEEVTSVLGIARRLPDTSTEPYSDCQWESIDIAAASSAAQAHEALVDAFRNIDAVIHLAWLIQPNDKRELLRSVNVEGTRRVAEAAAEAGVPRLVVASSVGAYSPDEARDGISGANDNPPLRAEDFPARGIESSHYSADKGAVEEVLDEFEAAHPDVSVVRLRPGLTFQRQAASEIQRYFLGNRVPVGVLANGSLPLVPLPRGLRLQAVHADDLARAYAAAATGSVRGAFNICADDVLGPQELAEIVDHGKFTELPPAMVRAALAAAQKTGAVPADPGWLDMGMQVPLMDNTKAKSELGWTPQHTAADTVRELLDGMRDGAGYNSPALYPNETDQQVIRSLGMSVKDVVEYTNDEDEAAQPGKTDLELLHLYIDDHLTGATAGVDRIERMAAEYQDTPQFATLDALARAIRGDKEFLRSLIDSLGFDRKPYRQAAAWVGEKAGRLKLNRRVTKRSPMSMVLETELLQGAVAAKRGGWVTLRDYSTELGLTPDVFDELIAAADRQQEQLQKVHAYATSAAFREDRDLFAHDK